ncbi:LANO_0H18998g1_1 [Lachancea nothofagi CBS 11611]|uniref:LANO_0H18998g1_1 n=1 Tax=Lachancea nothofagi CBS 11611 TaxID=1266666 RepID=A0A1G4KN53_9SACH|nr:LANO_0H18998g1_1 [Lachancea nothofagi CBS 11611]
MNYSALEPVSAKTNNTATSGVVRTSRKWSLPARTKPGRRPMMHLRERVDSSDEQDSNRKVKNREAQRAYRERQINQVQNLEEQVEKLSQKCDAYKQKLHKQSVDLKRLENEKLLLAHRIEELEQPAQVPRNVAKCVMCTHEFCVCGEVGLEHGLNSQLENSAYITSDLQEQIDKFQPMEAVALPRPRRKRRKPEGCGNFPIFKKLKVPQEEKERASSPASDLNASVDDLNLEVGDQGCGFCSETSTCLCKELETHPITPESTFRHSCQKQSTSLRVITNKN